MIKVTHSFPVWLPQTQTWLYNQIKHTPADRIDNHIACERTENLDQFELPNIHLPSKVRYFFDRALIKLGIRQHISHTKNVLKKTDSRILHSHFGNIAWKNIDFVQKLRVKHIATFYGRDVNMLPQKKIWLDRYQELFQNVDLVLCEGVHMANCIGKLGCPRSKIKVQHLGVDMGKLPFKKRIWKKNDKLKVLISGTFRQKKGIPYALEALAEIKNELPLEITIIGDAAQETDKLEKHKILTALKKGDLEEMTEIKGYQPYDTLIKEAYNNHLFISPSIHADDGDTEGGAPVTITEMAKTGMPVVTTNHCDIPYVLKKYDETLFSAERDVASLIRVIKLFLENWHEYAIMIKKQASHIESNYNPITLSKNIAEIYSSTLA